MRCRSILLIFFIPALICILKITAPESQRPAKVTFGWKSRVMLHGHTTSKLPIGHIRMNLAVTGPTNGKLMNEQKNEEVETSAGTQGAVNLLNEWMKNQQNLVTELQSLISVDTDTNDPALISLIRRSLVPPSSSNLRTSYSMRMTSLEETIDRMFHSRVKGFFIEAGVYDGEGHSHTLWLEKVRGWTGLLVEPDPAYFLQLLGKSRKAWSMNAALSPSGGPSTVVLDDGERQLGPLGGIAGGGRQMLAPAFPLQSLLLALNWKRVDFLYIAADGDEWSIVRTIPWQDLDIRAIAVDVTKSLTAKSTFLNFLSAQGFTCQLHMEGNPRNVAKLEMEKPGLGKPNLNNVDGVQWKLDNLGAGGEQETEQPIYDVPSKFKQTFNWVHKGIQEERKRAENHEDWQNGMASPSHVLCSLPETTLLDIYQETAPDDELYDNT